MIDLEKTVEEHGFYNKPDLSSSLGSPAHDLWDLEESQHTKPQCI